MSFCVMKELGVAFEFDEKFQAKLGNQWHTVKKLSVARLFSVLALSKLVDEYNMLGMTSLLCVDAIPGLGIAGTLWKSQFGEKVDVIVNTLDGKRATDGISSMNGKAVSSDINIVQETPNSLLHSGRIVNFIYLESTGNCVQYLEAACNAISHKGILCIVSTDLSTLYNKSPERVRRIYHGYTMKNEYMKETAVRIILANLARAASRHSRGFNVLLSYADADSVMVIARILRGATHADKSLDLVKKIAHCRECHFRCLCDEKFHLTQKFDVANCFCNENGQIDSEILPPIVLLGPIYTGLIFDSRFLYKMMRYLEVLDAKHKMISVMQGMILESCCCTSNEEETKLLKILAAEHVTQSTNPQSNSEPPLKKCKTEDFDELFAKYMDMEVPVLFAIPQTHTKKGCNPPKILDVLQKLRSKGYRASRTIFDPRGVRTSASLKELRQLIAAISKETPSVD